MRQFEFDGDTLTLTEGQYYKLLNRFDEGFAVEWPRPSVESYVIDRPCICDEFFGCTDCPLYIAPCRSCDRILAHAMGVDVSTVHKVFCLSEGEMSWQPHQDVYARRLIRKVYKALRRLPYIEEEGVE